MELKYNEIIGAIVKPDDTPATQAEILEWAAANSMPIDCLLYTSPSPRDGLLSRMPSSA